MLFGVRKVCPEKADELIENKASVGEVKNFIN